MRRITRTDYDALDGSKPIVNAWVRKVGLADEMLLEIEETDDPYVVKCRHWQKGWNGELARDAQGHAWISQAFFHVRKPFPFERIELLRTLANQGPPAGRDHEQCIRMIQNGGDPWSAASSSARSSSSSASA